MQKCGAVECITLQGDVFAPSEWSSVEGQLLNTRKVKQSPNFGMGIVFSCLARFFS